ncbi:MAG: Arc family DNA binding domain-containing protein [Puniceicoccaceae bacterium]
MAARKAFLIRINEKLFKELESWAHEEFRSVNGQIEFLLRQQVMRRKGDQKKEDSAKEE